LHFDHGRLDVVSDANSQISALPMRYNARPLTIVFNTRHLTDVLRLHAAHDIISIGITDDASPVVIRGLRDPRFTYVLMPLTSENGETQ
jgi:DNA polymerase III sliding clamp (beta) subunit (PCNA family)